MPSWGELLAEVTKSPDPTATINSKMEDVLGGISALCGGKEVLFYSSGFLQKPGNRETSIISEDMNGFMNAVYGLECDKGLALILHTEGGDLYAVESIVEYLHGKFKNITAIVPYMAMSGGSMISLACDKIILGKQSQIGPIDPQITSGNKRHSARAITDAFKRAQSDIQKDVLNAHLWHPVLASMGPSLIIEAEKALDYSKELVSKWLQARMFHGEANAAESAERVAAFFNAETDGIHMHGQRIAIEALQQHGVKAVALESDQDLQEKVLTAYHLMTLIYEKSPTIKFITTNHKDGLWVKSPPPMVMPAQFIQQPPPQRTGV